MKNFNICCAAVFCLGLSHIAFSQDDYVKSTPEFKDCVFQNNIKTVQLFVQGLETSFPAIRLGTEDLLNFSFDDLDADNKTYFYTLIHCDYRWQASDLSQSDYISGFHEEQISTNAHSFNTIQTYTHYRLSFPTPSMQITKSGNYIIQVFTDDNRYQLVITRRFCVYEDFVAVGFDIHQPILNDFRYTKQEVDFSINAIDYNILDPMNDLQVVIIQNDNWNTAVYELKPVFIKDKILEYNEDEKNVFNGGKEFRYFNSQSLRNPDIKINRIRTDSADFRHIYLNQDEKRGFKRYASEKDINGKYVIRTTVGDSPDTDADYCYIHFSLPSDYELSGGPVFVYGGLSDWQFKPEFKMNYNALSKEYTSSVFLKQGFYNYAYVQLTGSQPDATYTEGNRFETENEYSILVYHQPIGVFYDRLIGYKKRIYNITGK